MRQASNFKKTLEIGIFNWLPTNDAKHAIHLHKVLQYLTSSQHDSKNLTITIKSKHEKKENNVKI